MCISFLPTVWFIFKLSGRTHAGLFVEIKTENSKFSLAAETGSVKAYSIINLRDSGALVRGIEN